MPVVFKQHILLAKMSHTAATKTRTRPDNLFRGLTHSHLEHTQALTGREIS